MGCYRPIPASQRYSGAPVKLWPPIGEQHLAIPCGNCIGCKSARAAAWGKRCEHEMTRWDHNVFLTLTYDDDTLPEGAHLRAEDLQRFIKRLRKHATRTTSHLRQTGSTTIRYLACGEYGSRSGRPHYHMLAFNCDFTDGAKTGQHGEHTLYESDTLHTLWGHGRANYGQATGASANYIAQYTLKKQGTRTTDCDDDGVYRPPPFLRMSLKPAIGAEWAKHYADDMTKGFLTSNGHKYAIPRTYRNTLKKNGDTRYDEIELAIAQNKQIETPEQLRAHEIIHTRLKQLTDRRRI